MYTLHGSLGERRSRLVELALSLPRVGERGQGCQITDRNHTRDAFYPHMSDLLPGTWDIAFVVLMPQHSYLPVHEDGVLGKVQRYVAVLQTNPYCACVHGGDWQHLEQGQLYKLAAEHPHGSVNLGNPVRIHLSIDVQL